MGISAKQLAAEVNASPQAALTGFLRTLRQLDTQTRAETIARLFGLEYQDDISLLVGSLDQYEAALERVADATDGALDKEFNTRMETAAAQVAVLKQNFEVLAVNLGQGFLPLISAASGGLAEMAKVIADFAEANTGFVAIAQFVLALTAAWGGLKVAFLAAGVVGGKVLTRMKADVIALNTAFRTLAATGVSAGLRGALSSLSGFLLGPWGFAVAGAIGLMGAFSEQSEAAAQSQLDLSQSVEEAAKQFNALSEAQRNLAKADLSGQLAATKDAYLDNLRDLARAARSAMPDARAVTEVRRSLAVLPHEKLF